MHALLHSSCSREFVIDGTSKTPGEEVSSQLLVMYLAAELVKQETNKKSSCRYMRIFAEATSHPVLRNMDDRNWT